MIIFEGAKSVMLAETWGINNTAAILTSHLNPFQMTTLMKLGVRLVIAFDEDARPDLDENIKKLRHFVKIELVENTKKVLDEKMSPVDKGYDVWKFLYNKRRAIN